MAVTYSTNLGLALPAQGDWAGTWGTNQNNYITQYLDAAIAGAQTISGTQTAVTLSANNGTSLTQAGLAGTTGSALYQIINCTGNPAGTLTVTVPNTSKVYLVLNATSTNQSVTVKASATTGVTVAAGKAALIAWNGSDFTLVSTTDASKLVGVISVANGGTGLSSGTSGGVPYFSGSTTMASSAALAANALVVGGGAGAAPSSIITGTGVTSALGVNVGTAGSFVVNGGALGIPASGTLTNATGLPLSTGVTGTLSVSNGGTGATTLTGLLLGNGTSAVTTVTAPSGTVVGTTDTQTLTNKRITSRVVSIASASTITPTGDTADQYNVTALAVPASVAAPSGTPTDGQKLILRLKDDGTARALTWTTTSGAYRVIGTTLPTTTVATKTTYVGCIYNATDVFWDVVAVTTQA